MAEDNWNVKWLRPRDEEEEEDSAGIFAQFQLISKVVRHELC